MKRIPIIGLVGGIGSGKSTVASLLVEAGAVVIDSDVLNRAQLCQPEVVDALKSWWGESVCDGTGALDRGKIADVIFNDPEQRKRLEAYVHPRVAEERSRMIDT